MTLLHLQYFCAVARHESIGKAAKELFVSQPAISKTLNSLEKELGTTLFDRHGRNLVLNHNGQFFYENVSRGLGIIEHAVNTLSRQPSNKEIHLCINCGDLFLEEAIVAYRELHPDVFFVLSSETQPDYHAAVSSVDLTVFSSPKGADVSKRQHLLFTERFGIIIPKTDPLSQRKSIDLAEAADRRFIGTDSYGINKMLCQEVGFSPLIAIVGQNIHIYMKMLESNAGVSIAPRLSIARYLPDNCVFVPLHSPVRSRTVIIQENLTKHTSPHAADFIRFCVELARQAQARQP